MKLNNIVIVILVASVMVIAGCTSSGITDEKHSPDGTTTLPSPTVPTLSPVVSGSTVAPLPVSTTSAGTKSGSAASSPLAQKDVNKHFLTVAFSDYNGVVIRQERGKNTPMSVALFGNYTSEDVATIQEFIKYFNRVAKTQKLYGTVKTYADGEADLWINVLSEKELHSMPEQKIGYVKYQSMDSDTILYEVLPQEQVLATPEWNQTGQVYVNGDLSGDERRHYILRAVTYWLGITGDAVDSDSFFFPDNTRQVTFSDEDWRAMGILYGPVVKNKMTVSDVKSRMYTGSSS